MGQIPMANRKFLTILGLIAQSARTIGLGLFLQSALDLVDAIFLRIGKLPLKINIDEHIIHGCFRHRSFLDHISTGRYEVFTTELFKKHLRPGMTVIDGGAHIGFYTLVAARYVRSTGRVFAFEPDPHNFQCLVFNINKNLYQNVTTFQKSIAEKVRDTILYQSSGTISSSLGYRQEVRSFLMGIHIKKLSVRSTTLDTELEGIPVDVVKLDIEGAELLALQGMTKILQKNQSLVLFVEINPSALHSLHTSPEALIRKLEDFGFSLYFIDESNKRLLPLTRESVIRKGNLYCKRGE
jgi:FkbM family methyltransferase